MTVPQANPVEVYAGDTLSFPTYRFTETIDGVTTPEDLTAWIGWTAQWRVNEYSVDAITLAVDITEGANGILTLTATAEQTDAMGTGGMWDVQATHPEAGVRTFLRGTTTWTKDVTR